MNIKTNKIILIFFVLMLAMPIFTFNVGATESTITTALKVVESMTKSLAVTSNGTLYAFLCDTASPMFNKLFRSYDNGVTWVQNQTITSSQANTWSSAIAVQDNDDIHLVYLWHDGVQCRIVHRTFYSNGTLSLYTTVYDNPHANSEYKGIDITMDSENMYVAWCWQQDTTGFAYVYYRAYNFILKTWGTTVALAIKSTYNPVYVKPSIITYNSDIFVFYENQTANDKIEYAHYHSSNTSWTKNHDLVSSATYEYHRPCAIVLGNKIYVFYSGNTSTDPTAESLLYKTSSNGVSWSSQSLLHSNTGYSQREPTASINSDGTLNVVWSGQSVISSTWYQLRQRVYSGGSWGDTAFISSGSTTKRFPYLCYQSYPSFTQLNDGVVIAYADETNDDLEYIDSGSLLWYSGGEGEYSGDFEFDANNNIGSLDTGCTIGLTIKTVEFKYMIPTTINATGFDLYVNSIMHNYDNDLSNYDLYINGDPLGNPTEWKEYGGHYVLRWTFSSEKVITNSEILFEVWHDKLIGSVYNYWVIGMSCNYEDLDGDGVGFSKVHDVYPNGVFDGSWIQKDVAYQLYYNVIQFVEDETDVTYNSISFVNTTYYVGESVPLTYTIKASDLVYDNYVRIWNDDTSTEISLGSMQGFPYLTQHQVETIGFVPFTSANYTAHLYINSVEVDNVSFYPQDHINPDMYVFTYENPSNVGQKIWVYYNFDHPTNKSGAIFLSLTPNLNNYLSVNYLSDGDSGFWTTSHDTVGVYYYIMAVDINGNGTYGIVNNGIHPHTVKNEHGNNFFTVRWSNLRLGIDGTTTQTISGESNIVSGNCYIYDNNQLVKTITESPFYFSYNVQTAGLHTVEMRLITNLTIILCTQNYTVTTYTGDAEIEQVEDSGYVIRDYIYNEWGDFGIFIAGVGIILGFMLIPFALVLYVNVAYNKNVDLGDIHWSIYLIFAIVGVAVTVMLHIADLWLILLIVVACITIAVVIFKGNNG